MVEVIRTINAAEFEPGSAEGGGERRANRTGRAGQEPFEPPLGRVAVASEALWATQTTVPSVNYRPLTFEPGFAVGVGGCRDDRKAGLLGLSWFARLSRAAFSGGGVAGCGPWFWLIGILLVDPLLDTTSSAKNGRSELRLSCDSRGVLCEGRRSWFSVRPASRATHLPEAGNRG